MSDTLEAALKYAAQGWPVFPCRADKEPYIKGGVLSATTNKKQIKEWWDTWPRANVAMDVGSAGLMVIDLDPGHCIEDLENAVGPLPPTKLRQRTPRGGAHLFYEIDDGEVIPPSASKLSEAVDVRSFHSYVLLAPSRTSDGVYEWESQGKPAYRSDSIAEAAKAGSRSKSGDRDNWIVEPDLPENIDLCVEWLKHSAKVAVEGVNGDHMAYSTAAMCKSYGISPELALDLMWEHWNPRCNPPWSPDEIDHLERKIENGYSYNTSPPGNMTPAYQVAKSQALFQPRKRETAMGGREIKAGRFRIVDRAGMAEIRPPKWLVEGFLPEEGFGLLVGPRGTFKTFVALDVALSVATGASQFFAGEDAEDWLGPWPQIGKPGPVLYAAGEGRSGITSRVKAWERYHLDDHQTNNLFLIDPVPGPNAEDVTPFIESALGMSPDGYRLVILDTVGRAMQGLNENSQQDASMFTRMVQTIQQALGAAVLAIHHTGHGEATRGRGSSVFGADVDAEFILQREGKDHVIKLVNTKQKDAPEWEEPKLVQMRNIKLGPDSTSLVASLPDKKVADAEEKAKAAEAQKDAKKGRKSPKEFQEEMELVRKAAYQTLKKAPGKEFSGRALAMAISAHEQISIGEQAVRKRYFDHLLTDKAHPLVQCYDVVKQKWIYHAPERVKE